MYKVSPSYYLKRAIAAKTYEDSVTYWSAYWRTLATHSYFIAEAYREGYTKLGKKIADTMFPVGA